MRLPAWLEAEVDRCTRCGKCRSVCPVFEQTLNEATAARGRIRLIEEALAGRMPASRRFEVYLSTCLLCRRCSSVCPAAVRFDDLMSAARGQVCGTWWRYRLGRLGMRLVAPRRWAFDLVMAQARRVGAPLAERTALQRWGGDVLDGRPRIGLFVGCLMNYLYPDIIEAVLAYCRRRGIGVVVPRGQVCCGTPALSLGSPGLAGRLARRNAEVFLAAGVSTVVTACAACGRTIKDVWPRFAGRRWRDIRVLDFSELAADMGHVGAARRDRRVTYHDPCHLKFGQGISDEPRAVLRRAAELVEMEDADACCGSGGLFQVFHPDLAAQIGDVKADAIAACEAPTVVTSCPACLMQIRMTLRRRGVDRHVTHVANVIAGASESRSTEA